ncbi:hypothetical protein JCM19237_4039 [Photobacterium aphoticum]|uniref:Uncharacterized protein n=1 Tax=Photobacterium aphoticum TaxID=754436 RepID=A0A090R2R9_9GAMM|nr:hypothetical protein JCM19237_4039 [Photobacterium aphoticum]
MAGFGLQAAFSAARGSRNGVSNPSARGKSVISASGEVAWP